MYCVINLRLGGTQSIAQLVLKSFRVCGGYNMYCTYTTISVLCHVHTSQTCPKSATVYLEPVSHFMHFCNYYMIKTDGGKGYSIKSGFLQLYPKIFPPPCCTHVLVSRDPTISLVIYSTPSSKGPLICQFRCSISECNK